MTAALEKTSIETGETRDFLTILIGDQYFGIPILQVQDVLGAQRLTRVPLSPPAISGALNLRGRIVTAINVHACMGIAQGGSAPDMSVVVENKGELFSLMIDKVGDVLSLSDGDFEKNPGTFNAQWRDVCSGLYRLKDKLLVILDVPRLLGTLEIEEEVPV